MMGNSIFSATLHMSIYDRIKSNIDFGVMNKIEQVDKYTNIESENNEDQLHCL